MSNSPAPRIPEAIDALQAVLAREKGEGKERLPLSEESMEKLRSLPTRLASAKRAAMAAEDPGPVTARTPKLEEEAAPGRVRPVPEQGVAAEGDRDARIAALKAQAENDEECRALGTLRDTMVFSVGNPCSDLMFVGEAPGFEEERQREPFVGPAGQKLTQIIQAMGLRRPDDVYISNIVKFRPLDGDARFQGQRNRKPSPVEMGASVKYVKAEIEIVRPKAIVALGATAAEGLLEISGSISRLRNQFHNLDGIPVMVTYHPSYLLRQESKTPDRGKADKRKVWEDMLLVMERMGLPVSEKQRGYFL